MNFTTERTRTGEGPARRCFTPEHVGYTLGTLSRLSRTGKSLPASLLAQAVCTLTDPLTIGDLVRRR